MNTLKDAPIYNAETVSRLLEIPYDEEELAKLSNPPPVPGYVTYFDPGWSILILRDAVSDKGSIVCPQNWYEDEPFADFEEELQYRQLRMAAVEDSFGKTFAEQQALVPPGLEIPTARVVLMAMAIRLLASGERLYPSCWVRCVDQTSYSSLVIVGGFDRGGVCVNAASPGYSDGDLGVVLSRKF